MDVSGASTGRRRLAGRQRGAAPPADVLRVGSFCSGMMTESMALRKLGIAHRTVFACESNPKMQKHIAANFEVERLLSDVCTDAFVNLPHVDLLVGGFPCQPFSAQGKNEGQADSKGRGTVIEWVIRHITLAQPKAFMLENVRGLLSRHRPFFNFILRGLRGVVDAGTGGPAYSVRWKLLRSDQFGVPQSRCRVFIVGCLRKHLRRPFAFPKPLPGKPASLRSILCPKGAPRGVIKSPGDRARLAAALRRITKKGIDFKRVAVAVDAHASKPAYKVDKIPCLTATRGGGGGFYITSVRRLMTVEEMMRAQGMDPEAIRVVTSPRQIGMAIGNAWTQPVVEQLLLQLFRALPLP